MNNVLILKKNSDYAIFTDDASVGNFFEFTYFATSIMSSYQVFWRTMVFSVHCFRLSNNYAFANSQVLYIVSLNTCYCRCSVVETRTFYLCFWILKMGTLNCQKHHFRHSIFVLYEEQKAIVKPE